MTNNDLPVLCIAVALAGLLAMLIVGVDKLETRITALEARQ